MESSPGQGATFDIYLPQTSERIPEKEKEAKPAAVARGSGTVLVVEDQEGVRELAAEFLRASGYFVLEAVDGVEALEVAQRFGNRIHVLLTDIVMPRMGGVELAKRFVLRQPDAKVILMSGYSEQLGDQKEEAIAKFSILQKPFSMSSLGEAVRQVLAGETLTEIGEPGVKQVS